MLPPQKMYTEVRTLQQSRLPLGLVACSSAAAGAMAALVAAVVIHGNAPWLFEPFGPATPAASAAPAVASCTRVSVSGLKFGPSRAEEVLGELNAAEVKTVATWFSTEFGATGMRNASKDCLWIAGPSAVELLIPPKTDSVAYLDGKGPKPPRFARVTAVGPAGVDEYRVGPIEGGKMAARATAKQLTNKGDIPYVKRPTENSADSLIGEGIVNRTFKIMEPVLVASFGNVFPQFAGFDPKEGSVDQIFRNDALGPPGQRADILIFQWFPPAPVRPEAAWLHPLPLTIKLNSTSSDPAQWAVSAVWFCGQGPFNSAAELMESHKHGGIRICPFSKETGIWDVPQRVTPKDPAGRQNLETNGGVAWGPWNFTVTQRPSTGAALLDVRFRGERVLYELALQDAFAAYSGNEKTQFFYSDAAWSLSQLSASLEPGVDCPEGAHYVPVTNWFHILPGGTAVADPTNPREFYPVCVFEWTEDHTIWRHMQNSNPPDVRGLVRKTVVVRSIATVGNYDYITDIKLREDGEIELKTRFAGFIEARHFDPKGNPEEMNFSTIIRPDLAGPVHSHLVNWKADFDIAGVRSNAFQTIKVKAGPLKNSNFAGTQEPMISKYLEREYVEREGIGKSTFVAAPQHPTVWSVVDRHATSAAGNPRGYAIALASWSNTQVLPDDHPFTRAVPLTKYHLAITKHHDDEYRSTSPYVQYDGAETVKNTQDLDRFLSDGEAIIDEDIVAWIGVGREHIVRQEDLPLVSNFGAGFSLVPWNFFTQNVAASPPWEA